MQANMKLHGKTALVTGAGSNLGQVYAQALAAEGAAVLIGDLDGALAESAAAELRTTGATAIGVEMDVGRDDHILGAVDLAVRELGGIDILVNNAGLARGRWSLCSELSSDDWREIMSVNVVSAVTAARACRPIMAARGGGVIVNQSSMAAYAALSSAYAVSKLAISGVTVALASEFAPDKIRVNGIAPGMMNGRLPQEIVDNIVRQQLIQRRGAPEDLAGALIFLTTDASAFMTGQTLIVDGGPARRP
jgi:3-oxoacyl-[acyl-carrier protein] reductase